MSSFARQLPRVMPLAQVAREILLMDLHDAYKSVRRGEIRGAFKIGKRWYVSLPAMVAGMKPKPLPCLHFERDATSVAGTAAGKLDGV